MAKCGRVLEPAEIRRVSSDENGMPQSANHVSGLGEKQTGDERNVAPQSMGVALVDEIRRHKHSGKTFASWGHKRERKAQ